MCSESSSSSLLLYQTLSCHVFKISWSPIVKSSETITFSNLTIPFSFDRFSKIFFLSSEEFKITLIVLVFPRAFLPNLATYFTGVSLKIPSIRSLTSAQLEGEGEASPVLLWNQKKCPDFGKKVLIVSNFVLNFPFKM